MEQTEDREHIEDRIKPVADILISIFFVYAGTLMDVRSLLNLLILPLIAVLAVAAIAWKPLAGYLLWEKGRSRVIGLGMVPRGEVVLVFAQLGLSHAIISQELYSALIVVILLTTVIAPPLLRRALRQMTPA